MIRGAIGIFFQAEDGIRDNGVTGVQTCALPIWVLRRPDGRARPDAVPCRWTRSAGGLGEPRGLRPHGGAVVGTLPCARRSRPRGSHPAGVVRGDRSCPGRPAGRPGSVRACALRRAAEGAVRRRRGLPRALVSGAGSNQRRMPIQDDTQLTHVATLDYEGRRYNVSVRTSFDGVEYVGRLFFADDGWEDAALPDRGALPGRTREEVLALEIGRAHV